MKNRFTPVVAIIGALALIGSLMTNAFASQPAAPAHDKKFVVKGTLTVTGTLKVRKNLNVTGPGRLYAHNGAQVWNGLTVKTGVLTANTLAVTNAGTFGSAQVNGNLSAVNITSTGTLSTTGTASIGGKLTANGIDAGAGNISTTGTLSVGTFNPTNLSTGNITASGAVGVAGTLTAQNLTVPGTVSFGSSHVDFSGATVTGLPGGGVGSNPASLSVGTASGTTAPLVIQQNNKAATIGVGTGGDLLVGSLTASGNLIVGGTGGLSTTLVTAPSTTSGTTTTLGTLTLTGNGIVHNGNTTLASGSDLNFTTSGSGPSALASHVNAANDGDVAGQALVQVPVQTAAGPNTLVVPFAKNYVTRPIVVITPSSDPGLNGRYWVTPNTASTGGGYSGFTITYVPAGPVATATNVTFDYHVIGQ